MSKKRHELCDMCDKGYPVNSHQDQTKAYKDAQAWNEKYPVGTPVVYEEVIGLTEPLHTKTRSEAWPLGGHTAVAMIEGRSGGCSIKHMKPHGV